MTAAPVDLRGLEDPAPAVRYETSRKLTAQGAVVVPELIKALSSPRPLLRELAAHALAGFGQEGTGALAKAAVPKLGELLAKDPVGPVRSSAARALGLLARDLQGADQAAALKALRGGLKDAEPDTRSSVAMAVAALDPSSKEAAAELEQALGRPEPEGTNLHQEACFRLEAMGASAAPAVPGIAGLLASPDEDLRATAIETLAKLGKVAAPSAPALRALQKKASGREAAAVKQALAAVGQ